MKKIPIVLASDNNYAAQMYITILSAIKNKNKDSFYEFYCLVPKPFSKFIRNKYKRLMTNSINVSIKFIYMGNEFSTTEMQIPHITSPTYYRLEMAELLPQHKKAIYLDVDTIVLQDLSELFDTDLENNYIGGVHSAGYEIDYKNNEDYYNSIGLCDMSQYINAGILLFNLELIRKDNMTPQLLNLVDKNFRFMDQDIINLLFYKRIKNLDFRYNIMVSYKKRFFDTPELLQKVYDIYGEENFKASLENPVVIHYVTENKPWLDKTVWLGNYWHKYAMKSSLKCKKLPSIKQKFMKQVNEMKFKKVVFWGASLFLEEMLNKTELKQHRVVGIIDKDPSKHGKKLGKHTIYAPEDLEKLKPDVIIFTIKHNYKEIYPIIKDFVKSNYPKINLLPCIF